MRAFNLLANGSGGIDWAGLPLVAAYLGITRVEPLMHALGVIKAHRPARADDTGNTSGPDPLGLQRD